MFIFREIIFKIKKLFRSHPLFFSFVSSFIFVLLFFSIILFFNKGGIKAFVNSSKGSYIVTPYNNSFYTINAYHEQNFMSFINLDNIKELKISIFKSDLENFLNHYSFNKIDLPNLRLFKTWDLECEKKESVTIKLPKGEGLFFVVMEYNGNQTAFHYLVTKYAFLAERVNGQYISLAVDVKNGQPLNGATLKYFRIDQDVSPELLWVGQTNDKGFSRFDSKQKLPNIIVGEFNGKLVINDISQHSGRNEIRNPYYKVYLYTDRPLYKPGDNVNFKGIVRLDKDANYLIPAGKKITLKVAVNWNSPPIFEREYICNEEGIFFGRLELNEELKTGSYYLSAFLENEEIGSCLISVEKYVKPEFELTLDCLKDVVIKGENIKVKVLAKYFFGAPVENKKINYKLLDEDDKELKFGEVILNKKGEALIEISAPSYDTEKIFMLEASLADESGRPSYVKQRVRALPANIDFRILLDNWRAEKNEEKNILIKALDLNGQPLKNLSVELLISRDFWKKKGSQWDETNEKVAGYKLVTDSYGKINQAFTPSKTGLYRLVLKTKDEKKREMSKELSFWIWDDENNDVSQQNASFDFFSNKNEYKVGEMASFQVKFPVEKGTFLITLNRGALYKSWAQNFSKYQASFVLPVTEEFMPNVFAQVTLFANGDFLYKEKELEVPALSKKINIEIVPDSSKALPGRELGVIIKAKDYQGRPLRTNASLALVDKALFALMDNNAYDIFESFYYSRSDALEYFSSLENPYYGAEKGGCFLKGTKIVATDSKLKNIEDLKIGDNILTKKSQNSNQLVSAQVTKIYKHIVRECLIINNQLRITPAHILRINGKWLEAWKIKNGDKLLDINGKLVKVNKIERKYGRFEVFNLKIKDLHTFFADGFYVHNDKGDTEPRKNFVDVAYWNPNIITNPQGIAKVTVKLPDNLTTWVAHAKAVSRDTKVGQGENEIEVSKPFFVRPLLPRFVRNGDFVEIGATIHNYFDASNKVIVDFNSLQLNILSPRVREFILKPKEVKELKWQVKVLPKTSAQLIFSAKSSRGDDVVIVNLPIKPFGKEKDYAVGGIAPGQFTFTVEAGAIDAYSQYSLFLSPSVASKFPRMLEALIGYPYGCTEQTMSRLFPCALVYRYQNALRINPPSDLKVMINKGLIRLASFQHSDGGWGWWADDDTNLQMTAYVVEGLINIKKSGLPVFDKMLEDGIECLSKSITNESDPNIQAYSLFVLSSTDKNLDINLLTKLFHEISHHKDLRMQGICYMAMAIDNLGIKSLAKDLVQVVRQAVKKDYYGYFWEDSKTDANPSFINSSELISAVALRTFIKILPEEKIIPEIVQHLLVNKDFDVTRNTAAKLSALVEYVANFENFMPSGNYKVLLNGEPLTEGTIKNSQEVKIDIPTTILKDNNKIEIVFNGTGKLFYAFEQKEYQAAKNIPSNGSQFYINREYKKISGEWGNIFKIGDIVKVVLTIDAKKDIDYVMVEDHLPAGLEPVNMKFKNEAKDLDEDFFNEYYYGWDEKDIRDDRVATFITHLAKGSRKISYLLRAVTPGKTRAIPARVESMYYPAYNARSNSCLIEVK